MVWLSGWSVSLQTEGSPTPSPPRVHAWARGVQEATDQCVSHTSVFLPLSFSLSPILSKNKQIQYFKKEM